MPKILIVDDDEGGRHLLSRVLGPAGYDTITAENGRQALDAFREHQPDLIITDLKMPVMDGFELAEAVRREANPAHIPIIFISAMYKDIQSREKAMDVGGNEYLTHPFDHDDLIVRVKAMLRDKYLYDELLASREALRESEQKYRTLFNSATDAIYLIHTKTQEILDCNPKASEVTGYTEKELKSMTIADLHPAGEQDIVAKIFRKMNKTGKFSDVAGLNNLSKDGRLIPIEINATTLAMGDRLYSLGIFRDITERKKAEELLRHEKNKLLSILDTMQDGVYIVNRDYEIEYVNPVLRKTFGATVGHKCYNFFHRNRKVCPMCKNNEVFSGNSIRWEWKSPKNRRVYDIIETPISNSDRTVSKLAIFRDITERKSSEEALERSRAKFEAVINAIPDAVIFVDTQRNIIMTNPAVRTMFGYDSEELQGRTTELLYVEKAHYEEQGKQRFHVGAPEDIEPYEVKYRRRDNSVFTGETLGTTVKNANGDTIGFIGIIRDITIRKRMEARLREAAVTDDLTGLFNRRGFITLAEKNLNLAKRQKKKLALLYLDLDNLKHINDRLGHTEGDRALKDAADMLKRSFRESDVVARIGGDEFGVLLTEVTGSVDTILAHLRENIELMNERSSREYPVMISMGYAFYTPGSQASVDRLLSKADMSMYNNKRARKTGNNHGIAPAEGTGEKRTERRFRTGNGWSASFNGSGTTLIKDISRGGVCLVSHRRISPNATYEVTVVSPSKKEITASAIVMWSSRRKAAPDETKRDMLCETGFKFIRTSDAAGNALNRVISELGG